MAQSKTNKQKHQSPAPSIQAMGNWIEEQAGCTGEHAEKPMWSKHFLLFLFPHKNSVKNLVASQSVTLQRWGKTFIPILVRKAQAPPQHWSCHAGRGSEAAYPGSRGAHFQRRHSEIELIQPQRIQAEGTFSVYYTDIKKKMCISKKLPDRNRVVV